MSLWLLLGKAIIIGSYETLMKNFLLAFLVFLVWSFFGLWLYSWLNPTDSEEQATNGIVNTDLVNSEENQTISESIASDTETTLDTLSIDTAYKTEFIDEPVTGLKAISEDGDIIFLYPEGFTITKNRPTVDIDPELVDFKYKLNTYLLEHPDTELHINSQYSPSEVIASPNLGIQRGRAVKEVLVETGIAPQRVVIRPKITQIAFSEDDTFVHSFSFNFKELDNERIAALKKQIPESRTVYPTFSSQGIMVNEALNKFKEEVSDILKENPNLHIEVIGHTDNVGNALDNYSKGLEYARQLRWYLVNRANIDRNKITAISKGESEAIASNGSVKGRELNRRLEVKFYLDAND